MLIKEYRETLRNLEIEGRFALDSLPMKQMSIENELQNGKITTEQAKEKKVSLDHYIKRIDKNMEKFKRNHPILTFFFGRN